MFNSNDILKQITDWKPILSYFGVDKSQLSGKHKPCPSCGGTDRFRYDNKFGNGNYYCNGCGAGDGFSLLMKVNGWSFPEVIKQVAGYLGITDTKPITKKLKPIANTSKTHATAKAKKSINNILVSAKAITYDTAANKYLVKRGLNLQNFPESLSFHPALPYWEVKNDKPLNLGTFPALIAKVTDFNNHLVALHRTYLTMDGQKAEINHPKKLTKTITDAGLKGAAIKLQQPGKKLYLTEGLETALAVWLSIKEPVWACVSAFGLETIQIPPEVEKVYIMADKDLSGQGEQSANKLADRLIEEGRKTFIIIPEQSIPEGQKSIDWLDVFNSEDKAV